jgi:hypothetical protein
MLHDIHLRKVLTDDYIRGLAMSKPVPAEPGWARRSHSREARLASGKGAHGGNRPFPPAEFPPFDLRNSRA